MKCYKLTLTGRICRDVDGYPENVYLNKYETVGISNTEDNSDFKFYHHTGWYKDLMTSALYRIMIPISEDEFHERLGGIKMLEELKK